MTLTLSLNSGARGQSVTVSDEVSAAVCPADAAPVPGFTRQDLCVCRVYQQRARAGAEADGMLRKAIAEGKAERARAERCEGGAAELARRAEAERARADELMALRAVAAEREARRWSGLRSAGLGVCASGLVMTGAAWGLEASGRVTLSAAVVAVAGCALMVLVR